MIPNYYEFSNTTKILSGEYALENIPVELKALDAKKALVLCDETLKKIGTMQIVLDAVLNKGIEIGETYIEIPPDSSIEVIEKIVQIYLDKECDSIIAIGGGSVIDTAKGVRMMISQNVKNIMELAGCEMISYGKHIPFVAIPTTAGTGSEVTLVAVILNKCQNIKMEFISYYLLPDIAVLDPRMTISLPAKITAATGMDALCHAIESYTCLQKNPLSDSYATAAINLIRENLIEVCKNGNDKKRRLAMANASLMAGVAFSNSMVGIIHAIGHALGGVSRVPHGEAMAILMPYCMEYNLDKMGELYAELLLPLAGEEVYASTPKAERAKKTIETIRNMQQELNKLTGLPLTLSEKQVKKEDFEKIAKTATNDGALIVNPKNAEVKDIIEILNRAY